MGINICAGVSYLLMRNHSYQEYLGKKCLMLGVQDIDINGCDLVQLAQNLNFELHPSVYRIDKEELFHSFDAYDFFHYIGFEDVKAMDVSDYEGAEILADLNCPISDEHKNSFDLVYNGGTLEHVYNVTQGLINIGDMLKPGGIVIHDGPAAGWSDHGFYTFSPTLFRDYYAANRYSIEEIYLYQHVEGMPMTQYRSIDCRMLPPQSILSYKYDSRNEVSLLVCVAQKTPESTNGEIPLQGMYSEIFSDKNHLVDTVDYVRSDYEKIVIYGTGANARELYKRLEKAGKHVYLTEGKGGEKLRHGFKALSFADALEYADCMIIGSFRYAMEIEGRLKETCDEHGIRLINMNDIGGSHA